ncbi:unnamed protein product [Caenorhabditis nigoni]
MSCQATYIFKRSSIGLSSDVATSEEEQQVNPGVMSLKSNWCDEPKSNHSSTASFVWVTDGDNAAKRSPVRKEETMTTVGHGNRGLVCPRQI